MAEKGSHIAVFSLAYRPFAGGAEIAVEEIASRIRSRTFICFTRRFLRSWAPHEKRENVEVRRLGRGGKALYGGTLQKIAYVFLAWRAAEAAHRARPFSAAWAIMASYGGMAALLFKLSHPRVPLLLTLQEGDSEKHILRRVGVLYPFWRLIFSRADGAQAISSYLADFAERHGARRQIKVVPNGVNTRTYADYTQINADKRPNIFTIITTSRLVEKNGIDTLIRAFAQINSKIFTEGGSASGGKTQNFKLLIVGDGPLRSELEALARELGIAERVEFAGHVPPEKIPEYLSRADVFARLSRSEGLGNSFIEAMAAGLPVIGTPVGGIPDFLKDGETGIFARVDDAEDAAEKVRRIFSDEKLRMRLIENGRKLAETKYSWERIADEMDKIFHSLRARVRIAIAAGIVPPEVGGPAYYAFELARALKDQGNGVRIISYGWMKHLPAGVRHAAYFNKLFFLLFFIRADYVIALDTFSVGFPAVLAGKFAGIPVIIRTGGDFLWEFYVERTGEKIVFSDFYTRPRSFNTKERIIFRLTQWALRHASAAVFSTAYQRDAFVPAYGLEAARARIIENFYGETRENAEPAGKNFICFTRQLQWKNIDTLKRAFHKARARCPDIILETGALPRQKYMEKLKTCYAVILVSLGDISPNMILEAIQCKKPFILTRANGLESRIHGLGLRVNPLDEEDIAQAICRLANSSVYEQEKHNIEAFSFRHSYGGIARDFLNIFEKL